MALLDELDEMRMSYSGPTGSKANVEESRNYYMKLMAQQPTYEGELRERMRERDQRTADLRREERRAREELTNVRPQAYKKYGAEEPMGMPKMRPEDLTALVASKEAARQREIDKYRDEMTRRAGSKEEAIQRALSAYEARTNLAGELARQASEDYRTALSARSSRGGLSVSDALKLAERREEMNALKNVVTSKVREAFDAGYYFPPGADAENQYYAAKQGASIPGVIDVGSDKTPEKARQIARAALMDLSQDYSPAAVNYVSEYVGKDAFTQQEPLSTLFRNTQFNPYGTEDVFGPPSSTRTTTENKPGWLGKAAKAVWRRLPWVP